MTIVQNRIINFAIPNNITAEGFFNRNTDMFNWAKTPHEAKTDIIYDTRPLHFQCKKIIDDIPPNVRSKGNNDFVDLQKGNDNSDKQDA